MSRIPIRVLVTSAFAVAMAAVLVGFGLAVYLRISSQLTTALDTQLRVRAQDLAVLVSQPNARLSQQDAPGLIEHGESYAQLIDSEGVVRDATRPLGRASLLSVAEARAARRAPTFLERPSVPGLNEPSRLLATEVTRDGRRAVLVVGVTTQNRVETLATLRNELLIIGPIALILASGVGYLLAGLSLRSVESMRRRAAAISDDTPGERLPVPQTGDELQRLGETLNEMLGRLETALERERAFVADAGHELRTPLALLRTELELALRQAESVDELREAVRHSSEEASRLSQLAEDLLLIARSDRGQLPLRIEQVEVGELFAVVRSRVEWRAEAERKRVTTQTFPPASVLADRLRLEQALGNLVDNAIRYGGHEIQLRACAVDGEIELHVRDDGAGFPPGFLDRAFDRFTRADAARGRGGAGLGLAIVRTIAEAHGGSAHIANTDPSGADVWVSLPARSS